MNQPNNMQTFFNNLAATWNDRDEDRGIREEIVRRADIPESSVIADIGSGKGVMLPHLLGTNPKAIIAVDFAEEMLRHARETYKNERLSFIAGDLYEAPLPTLDAAMIFNAYPHFLDKKALCEKLSRHIRQGGFLVIAHSASKETVNGRHRMGLSFTLSVPLRRAEEEAAEFEESFALDSLEDSQSLYFLRMIRK